ncbi:MAG: 1-deoxy-D-xylulose-5-phosphate synthase [Oscillospiraceae bacterium]|jgi:1-deoxy-D-xylulose-5-phosphate synthase|nr:1-deoxy-D-xylulose-5-phosphate synthase [Oscillospiraceae bacterium]
MDYELLGNIHSPKDLNNIKDLNKLCDEIRHKIIETVSVNGGHLSSNLGAVELTVALHSVFNNDNDAIVWDVGHQSYTHKIITGRIGKLDTLRKEDGISGFTNSSESPYDIFTSGHSSTSISAALGLAVSKNINEDGGHVVAVIGDGALTGGLAYEGLNNTGKFNKNFTVVLNDNKMSISENVGAISRYLSKARTIPLYMKAKNTIENILDKIPIIGSDLKNLLIKFKSIIKFFFNNSTLFENMGFVCYGPIDGHNINELKSAFSIAKNINRPVLIHVITTKGKGYKFAEKNPRVFHGLSGFEIHTGSMRKKSLSFSDVFGDEICSIASKNPKICAITAAMVSGTSLSKFSYKHKKRFFDVGIAEGHAVTFAGGLSKGGLIPVFAVYSSFLQRSYDQIIHDCSLQGLNMILAIDRAGFIGDDGETHQGVFDVAFLNTIPSVTIFAPSYFIELRQMLNKAAKNPKGIIAVRYPRGGEYFCPSEFEYTGNTFDIYGKSPGDDAIIITYGRTFSFACEARNKLFKYGKAVSIMKLNIIKPIDPEAVKSAKKFSVVLFFEEGIKSGSAAEKFGAELIESEFFGKYVITAINDEFVKHAAVESQLKKYSLDSEGIIKKVLLELGIENEKKIRYNDF